MSSPTPLSRAQVNKAGKTIRRYLRGDVEPLSADLDAALKVLLAFRAKHQAPMTSANMALRYMVRAESSGEVEVSQRLKRVPTIIDKIRREPTMALSRMQDIGGCRAVLTSLEEVWRVYGRMEARGRIIDTTNYVDTPRNSGYRGVHVIVDYHECAIEIQLRTQVMHQWAVTVEQLSAALGEDVKSGAGPPEIQALMSEISAAMATEESGNEVSHEMLTELARLREAAAPHLTKGRRA